MADINASHVAMVRGVKNCGGHHEENATAAATLFAQGCDRCAGLLFVTIYNAGVAAMRDEAVHIVRRRGR